jgi:hypothetical protein
VADNFFDQFDAKPSASGGGNFFDQFDREPAVARSAPPRTTVAGAVNAAATGINSGVLDIAGLPVDVANNVLNLGKAAAGYGYSKLTGNAVPDALEIADPEAVLGSSAWLKAKARAAGGGTIIDPFQDTTINRVLHGAGEAVPAGAVGNEATLPSLVGAAGAGAAQQAAAEAGMPVISQVVAGALGGHVAGRLSSPRSPVAPATPALQSAQAALDELAGQRTQNVGAAVASPQVGAASPEIQQAIEAAATRNGGAMNSTALQRHLQADSVGVQLSRGQATGDPAQMSNELNHRGQIPDFARFLNTQNDALVGKLQDLRDVVGRDVFSTNQTEHGDTLIKAYKDKDAAVQADIRAKYQALRDANGGQFPVDPEQFVANADHELAAQMKARYLPAPIKADLADFRDGKGMTFTNFENLRTNLAAESRKAARAGDGNAEGALAIVRNQLEALPMSDRAAELKVLADQARSAARARFQALEADPAYKAAVTDSVPPDRFVNRFVVNGPRDDVALMHKHLADDPTALQTMGVATLDHLRNSAGISADGNGTFRQSGFNRSLQALSPKLRSLVDPGTANTLADLGDVSRYVHEQPAGSFVNNSNTLVGTLARRAGNFLIDRAPGGGLAKAGVQFVLDKASAARFMQHATAPGAGIEDVRAPGSSAYDAMMHAARLRAAEQLAALAHHSGHAAGAATSAGGSSGNQGP